MLGSVPRILYLEDVIIFILQIRNQISEKIRNLYKVRQLVRGVAMS